MSKSSTVASESPTTPVVDDLELLLDVLPRRIRSHLDARARREHLLEIVLDLGRIPEARYPGRVDDLGDAPVSEADLDEVLSHLGPFGGDNRAGIERTLHRISAIRNRTGRIIGLTCRVGRAVYGTVDILRDVVESGRSVLLLGRPGVGKTTLLREAARVLADDLRQRVVIVDTSNEIAGDGNVPHPGIGRARRLQVPTPDRQHALMIEAVENHMPEVIVIDEIGTAEEATAARTIAERGVQLIATAHGTALENLLRNPTLADLVGGIQPVTLSDEEARRRRTQKTVLERKAPPTFDVLVEIQSQDEMAVHRDLADVVDSFLRGFPPPAELRRRTSTGEVEVEPAPEREPTGDSDVGSSPWAPDARRSVRPLDRTLRLYLYAVSRSKLERACRELQVPVDVVRHLGEAEMVLTVKHQERKQPRKLDDARAKGLDVVVLRSNTVHQMLRFLMETFGLEDAQEDEQLALREVERAIDRVLDGDPPVELAPRDRMVRRLQHEAVEQAGLTSRSRGQEPYRRVVVTARA